MTAKTITIIGNVGSGKTTLAKIMAKELKATLIDADPYSTNPFLALYVTNHARWALATELFFTLSRAKALSSELENSHSRIRIIDSGLLMGIEIYAKHHLKSGTMTKSEWRLFQKISKIIVQPYLIYSNIVIFCRCDASTCFARIKSRGRKFESHHTRKYLIDLENNLLKLIPRLREKKIQVIELDMTIFDPRKDQDITRLTDRLFTLV